MKLHLPDPLPQILILKDVGQWGEPWVFLMSSPDAFYVAWEGDLRGTDLANP